MGLGVGEWFLRYLPVLLGALGSAPFFYQVYRDRRTRQALETDWSETLDLLSKAILLLERYLILDSDVDKLISAEMGALREGHKAVREKYALRNKDKKP